MVNSLPWVRIRSITIPFQYQQHRFKREEHLNLSHLTFYYVIGYSKFFKPIFLDSAVQIGRTTRLKSHKLCQTLAKAKSNSGPQPYKYTQLPLYKDMVVFIKHCRNNAKETGNHQRRQNNNIAILCKQLVLPTNCAPRHLKWKRWPRPYQDYLW